jgi:hypothetical protein
MSLSDHPRGRDGQLSNGPSERDIEAETERRNAEYDDARDEGRDETGEDEGRKA